MNCELMLTYDTPAYMFNVNKNQPSRQTGSRNLTGQNTLPTKCDEISDFCHQYLLRKMQRKISIHGSQKRFPQYGIPIWNLWPNIRFLSSIFAEKNATKNVHCHMLNVYKSQLSRQTGSRNLTGQKTLPTKRGTYLKLVMKYQISAINICWEKCDKKWAIYIFNVYKNQQLANRQ
jgi:hypothetical protein